MRTKDGHPSLQSYLWGLVPYWSKDPKKGARPVNARAETAHEKPMFRKLIRERRCLIPANCYYEWKEMPVGKRPYCIRMEDESPFFIGGMWDAWTREGRGSPLHVHCTDYVPERGIRNSPRPDAGDRPA